MLLTPVSKIMEFQEVILKGCFEMNLLMLQNQNFYLQIWKEMYLDIIPLLLAKMMSIGFISVLVSFHYLKKMKCIKWNFIIFVYYLNHWRDYSRFISGLHFHLTHLPAKVMSNKFIIVLVVIAHSFFYSLLTIKLCTIELNSGHCRNSEVIYGVESPRECRTNKRFSAQSWWPATFELMYALI